MLLTIPFIIIGFLLLYKGGDYLVSGAAGIAHKKNIPAFIVGITLVAFGTSAPELFFNIISALHGNAEFALSNVSGSNLINICVGIGVSAMVAPLTVTRHKFGKDLTFLCLGPMAVAVCVLFSAASALNFVHGLLFFSGFAVYIYQTKKKMTRHNQQMPAAVDSCTTESCRGEWLIFALGCAMLYAGGEVIYRNALKIVGFFGLSESMVGLTVIAVGQALATVGIKVLATARNQKDIAVGNILGSNIFNIFLVLATTIMVFGKPVVFSTSNYFDYIAVSILSLVFTAHILVRQKIGRFMGPFVLICYPAILYIRITYFSG